MSQPVFAPDDETPGIFASPQPIQFRRGFNEHDFEFRHHLRNHPSFSIPRLVEVAERMLASGKPGRFVVFRATRKSARTKFSQLPRDESLAEKVRQVSEGETWLKLAFAQEADPSFRRLHDRIIDELAALCDYPLRQDLGWSSLTIMVASPGVVTPYHIDHESNFLFQIRGEKEIWLFDPTDRRVLSEQEIERYYAGDINAADHRDGMQRAGTSYRLRPGTGVHNPPLAPHWVRNGDDVSVSMSLNFSLPGLESRARVYQANHCIRRLGMRPLPPERSALRDRLKNRVTSFLTPDRPASLDALLRSGLPCITRNLHAGEIAKRLSKAGRSAFRLP